MRLRSHSEDTAGKKPELSADVEKKKSHNGRGLSIFSLRAPEINDRPLIHQLHKDIIAYSIKSADSF